MHEQNVSVVIEWLWDITLRETNININIPSLSRRKAESGEFCMNVISLVNVAALALEDCMCLNGQDMAIVSC